MKYAINNYLLELGNNPSLSYLEASLRSKINATIPHTNLICLDSIVPYNYRNLPKTPYQQYLDELGGSLSLSQIVAINIPLENIHTAFYEYIKHYKDEHYKDTRMLLGVQYHNIKPMPDMLKHLSKQHYKLIHSPLESSSSARYFHENLSSKGIMMHIIYTDKQCILASTVAVQNLRNYALRDYKKPFRDTEMGMLPPKLAQILINLGGKKDVNTIIYDPFCGSGTIGNEASILGLCSINTDIDTIRIGNAVLNNEYLSAKFRYDKELMQLYTDDFTHPKYTPKTDFITITEGYLGTNFITKPSIPDIEESKKKVVDIWIRALKNRIKLGTRIVFCLPYWLYKGKHIYCRDHIYDGLEYMGYRKMYADDEFLYRRDDAFTGRDIQVWYKES